MKLLVLLTLGLVSGLCFAGEYGLRTETPLDIKLPVATATRFSVSNAYGNVTIYEEFGPDLVVRGNYHGFFSGTLRVVEREAGEMDLIVIFPKGERFGLTVGIPSAIFAGLRAESGSVSGDIRVTGKFENASADTRHLRLIAPAGRVAVQELRGAKRLEIEARGEANLFDVTSAGLTIASKLNSISIFRSTFASVVAMARWDIKPEKFMSFETTAQSDAGRIIGEEVNGDLILRAKDAIRLSGAFAKLIRAFSRRSVTISGSNADLEIDAVGQVDVDSHMAESVKITTQDRAILVDAEGDLEIAAGRGVDVRKGIAGKMNLNSSRGPITVRDSEADLRVVAEGEILVENIMGGTHSLVSRSGKHVEIRHVAGATDAHAGRGSILYFAHVEGNARGVAPRGSVTFYNPELVNGEEIAEARGPIRKTPADSCPRGVEVSAYRKSQLVPFGFPE